MRSFLCGYCFIFLSFFLDSGEGASSESDITNCYDASLEQGSSSQSESRAENEVSSGGQTQYTLLDLYSGCGGMSTGLCMGANLSNVKLVTVQHWILINIGFFLNANCSFPASLSFSLLQCYSEMGT